MHLCSQSFVFVSRAEISAVVEIMWIFVILVEYLWILLQVWHMWAPCVKYHLVNLLLLSKTSVISSQPVLLHTSLDIGNCIKAYS